MKAIIDQCLPQGSFFRNVLSLLWGASLGQFAVVLASPLLTRIYTPEEFGVLAVYASLLGILSSISGFRYELAVPMSRTDGNAANVLVLTLICVFITTTLIAIVVWLFGPRISIWCNVPEIIPFLWLLPIGLALAGFYQAFNYWAIRQQSFNLIAQTKMQQGIGGAISQVVLGLAHMGPFALIAGHIFGQAAGVLKLIRGAYRHDLHLLSRVRWQRIKHCARRYKRFPKYATWSSLANTSSNLLPILLFAVLFSPEVVGIYMLAHGTMYAPLKLVGNAIGQVFHAKAITAKRNENLEYLFTSTLINLLRLSVVPFIISVLFAPDIFEFVFGVDWRKAGVFVQFMAPWLVLQFCVSSVSQIINILEKQAGLLISQILFLSSRVGVIFISDYLGLDPTEIIASFSLASALLYLGHLLWICSVLNIKSKGLLKIFFGIFWFAKR